MTAPSYHVTEYRHHAHNCGRLLFQAYLPPGAKVNIVCPKCGRMAIFTGPAIAPVDITQQNGVYLNGTASTTTAAIIE